MLTHIVVLYLLYTLNAPAWCWVVEVVAIILSAVKFGIALSEGK